VKGRVIEVPVESNVPLKVGDVLFRVDPKPYEFAVSQKKAALAEAEQNVDQLKASLDQATAATEAAKAQLELARQNYDRQLELFEKRSSRKSRWTPSPAILKPQNRHCRVRKQRRSVHVSRSRRTSKASTPRSPA